MNRSRKGLGISWTAILITLMTLSSAYTLLDAFVIPKSYVVVAQTQTASSTTQFEVVGTQENAALIEVDALELDAPDLQENENPAEIDIVEPSAADVQEDSDAIEWNRIDEVEPTSASTSTSDVQTEVVITDHSYVDEHISINIETIDEDGVVYYVADIQLSHVDYLKTAFANNTFGRNVTQSTSEMAEANDAILAINGDYYGFRDTGLIIRNGMLYRDVPDNSMSDQSLTIDSEGNFEIVENDQASGLVLAEAGVLQSFSFGPTLVLDGEVVDTSNTTVSQGDNPRTAIGQISPLHYIFVVVDGRSDESDGMTLQQLAHVFADYGAEVAYNLDGGGSSALWFNGSLINNPTNGRRDGERDISDIIYIGY